jgi:hypothetical protein
MLYVSILTASDVETEFEAKTNDSYASSDIWVLDATAAHR